MTARTPPSVFTLADSLPLPANARAAPIAQALSRKYPAWPTARDAHGRTLPMRLLHVHPGSAPALHLLAHLVTEGTALLSTTADQDILHGLAARDDEGRSLWPYLLRAMLSGACANSGGVHLAVRRVLDKMHAAGMKEPPPDGMGRGAPAQMESLGACAPPTHNQQDGVPAPASLLRETLAMGNIAHAREVWSVTRLHAWMAGWKYDGADLCAALLPPPPGSTAPSPRMSAAGLVLAAIATHARTAAASLPCDQRSAFVNALLLDLSLHFYNPNSYGDAATTLEPWLAADVVLAPHTLEVVAGGIRNALSSQYAATGTSTLHAAAARLEALHAMAGQATALAAHSVSTRLRHRG